jgi:hypothetical protein
MHQRKSTKQIGKQVIQTITESVKRVWKLQNNPDKRRCLSLSGINKTL